MPQTDPFTEFLAQFPDECGTNQGAPDALLNVRPHPSTHTVAQAIVSVVHQSPVPVPGRYLLPVLKHLGFGEGIKSFPSQVRTALSSLHRRAYLVKEPGHAWSVNSTTVPAAAAGGGGAGTPEEIIHRDLAAGFRTVPMPIDNPNDL